MLLYKYEIHPNYARYRSKTTEGGVTTITTRLVEKDTNLDVEKEIRVMKDGKLHSLDTPAVICYRREHLNKFRIDGYDEISYSYSPLVETILSWYKEGKRHSIYGPAKVYPGGKEYYIEGKKVNETDWKFITRNLKIRGENYGVE